MEIHSSRLDDMFRALKRALKPYYSREELRPLVLILLTHATGISRAEITMNKEMELSESQILFLQTAVKRLQDYEPVQYVVGTANFHGYEFVVGPSVLIPRPETEELVEWVFSEQKDKKGVRLIDIGTGSGCIAITLKKKLPDMDVSAIDVSAEALVIAKENAHKLEADVSFQQLDILHTAERGHMAVYDIIVSNPPYVTAADRKNMKPNVTEYEPGQALYVEDDHMLYYREIVSVSKEHLSDGGSVYFETNERYATEVAQIMEDAGFSDISIRKDMQGKERMVRGTRY